MQLLFLTNYFPPAGFGGYEAWCHEVALGLRARGHGVTVLTSRHAAAACALADPPWVRRVLHTEQAMARWVNYPRSLLGRARRERHNAAALSAVLAETAADGVMVWGMWNLARSLAAQAETALPDRVIYYLGDYWPVLPDVWLTFWQQPGGARSARWARAAVSGMALRRARATTTVVPLQFRRPLLCSEFLGQELARRGRCLPAARCVPGAVDTRPYVGIARRSGGGLGDSDGGTLRLLFVGRLVADKGAHVAVAALGILVHERGITNLRLELVGSGSPDYRARLEASVADLGLAGQVVFRGPLDAAELPTVYADSDVFVFPSVWPEPFGRVLVEAMAAGLPVVGTAVGGAAEVMVAEETALVVPAEDAGALAAALGRLAADPGLRQRLGAAGRQRALARYDSQRMVADIEASWQAALA